MLASLLAISTLLSADPRLQALQDGKYREKMFPNTTALAVFEFLETPEARAELQMAVESLHLMQSAFPGLERTVPFIGINGSLFCPEELLVTGACGKKRGYLPRTYSDLHYLLQSQRAFLPHFGEYRIQLTDLGTGGEMFVGIDWIPEGSTKRIHIFNLLAEVPNEAANRTVDNVIREFLLGKYLGREDKVYGTELFDGFMRAAERGELAFIAGRTVVMRTARTFPSEADSAFAGAPIIIGGYVGKAKSGDMITLTAQPTPRMLVADVVNSSRDGMTRRRLPVVTLERESQEYVRIAVYMSPYEINVPTRSGSNLEVDIVSKTVDGVRTADMNVSIPAATSQGAFMSLPTSPSSATPVIALLRMPSITTEEKYYIVNVIVALIAGDLIPAEVYPPGSVLFHVPMTLPEMTPRPLTAIGQGISIIHTPEKDGFVLEVDGWWIVVVLALFLIVLRSLGLRRRQQAARRAAKARADDEAARVADQKQLDADMLQHAEELRVRQIAEREARDAAEKSDPRHVPVPKVVDAADVRRAREQLDALLAARKYSEETLEFVREQIEKAKDMKKPERALRFIDYAADRLKEEPPEEKEDDEADSAGV